MGFYEKEGKEG